MDDPIKNVLILKNLIYKREDYDEEINTLRNRCLRYFKNYRQDILPLIKHYPWSQENFQHEFTVVVEKIVRSPTTIVDGYYLYRAIHCRVLAWKIICLLKNSWTMIMTVDELISIFGRIIAQRLKLVKFQCAQLSIPFRLYERLELEFEVQKQKLHDAMIGGYIAGAITIFVVWRMLTDEI